MPSAAELAALGESELQTLTANLIRESAKRLEESYGEASVLSSKDALTPTEVMVFASALLKAANLAVFELGLWQSWGISEKT